MSGAEVFSIILSSLSFILAVSALFLKRQLAKDVWIRYAFSLNDTFWSDDGLGRVRAFISYAEAYDVLRPILLKRKRIEEQKAQVRESAAHEKQSASVGVERLNEHEQRTLDDVDHFLMKLNRATLIIPKLRNLNSAEGGDDSLIDEMELKSAIDPYWIKLIVDEKRERSELRWYVQTFFEETWAKMEDIHRIYNNEPALVSTDFRNPLG